MDYPSLHDVERWLRDNQHNARADAVKIAIDLLLEQSVELKVLRLQKTENKKRIETLESQKEYHERQASDYRKKWHYMMMQYEPKKYNDMFDDPPETGR